MKYDSFETETSAPSSATITTSPTGPEQLLQLDDPPHTRSTEWPRVNRPSGRTSSTRITAPNTNDGMYWLWFVGSAPPSSPVAKPIENPPSVAGIEAIHAAERRRPRAR